MFKQNRALSGMVLACTLIACQMALADGEQPIHLLIRPKMGRVLRTQSTIKITMMGMEMEVHAIEKATVTDVRENGDVVLEIIDEGSKISSAGKEDNLPVTPPYSTTHNKFGKTLQGKPKDNKDGFTTPEITKLMDTITDIVLTDKALKPNDTWQNELDNPAMPDKKVLVKDTYLGLDKIDGKDYWKVTQTAEAIVDAAGSKVTYEVTEWINPADGQNVKLDGTINNVPTRFGVMSMHVSAKSVLVDGKVKAEALPPVKKDN